MKELRLPENYSSRPATMADLELIQALEEKISRHYFQEEGLSLEAVRNEYETPGFTLEDSTRLVFDQQGQLAALIEVWDVWDPPVHPYLWLRADPELEDLQVLESLLAWGESRAMEVLDRVDPEVRVAMRSHAYQAIPSTAQVLKARGMVNIRHSFRMLIEMDQMPEEPGWPDGIRLRKYNPEQDAYAVFQVDDEVFEDHFGYVKMEDEQKAYQDFLHYMTREDTHDPEIWFLAGDGDEIAGICLCKTHAEHDRDCGWVSSLGVRRPWRRRGIARALLQHTFRVFYERGKYKVGLTVDAASLTGATDLYENVGMKVDRQYDLYEKVLREGKDVSVNTLEASE